MKRLVAFSLLSATVFGLSSPGLANDLQYYLTPLKSWVITTYDTDPRNIAVDADHNVFVTSDIALQKFTNDGRRLYFKLHGDGFLFRPDGVAVDGEGFVYVVNTYDHGVHKFTNDGEFVGAWHGPSDGSYLGSPFGIAVGDKGFLAVRTAGLINTFDTDGNLLDVWESGGGKGIAVDDQDYSYTGSYNLIYRYDRHGNLHNQFGPSPYPEGNFEAATGLAVDADGFIYLVDGSDRLRVFDAQGRFRAYFRGVGRPVSVALDGEDNIYLLDGATVRIFAPLAPLDPPPPPPVPATPTSVMLHLASPVMDGACGRVPGSINDVVTSGDAASEGIPYFVYVLLRSGDEQTGLAGVQFGIEYHGMGNGTAVKVTDWKTCADYEIPTDDWPESGSGNTITWVAPSNCQLQPIISAGYFYVSAYASATMSIVPYPANGKLRTANCTAKELLPDQELGLDQVGWVSMGRGAYGTDTNGCNPALEPCVRTVPVQSTTWGKLKSLYRN